VTFTISCILAAGALPYLLVILTGIPDRSGAASRWDGGYNNKDPRASAERLIGWRRRAHLAQLNGYEAFAPFAVGLLAAQLSNVDASLLRGLAVGFLVFRVLHAVFYVADKSTLRSVVWYGGIGCALALYIAALVAQP